MTLPRDESALRDFLGRYAMCPLCRREDVLLVFFAGSISFDEHAMKVPLVAAYAAPVDPEAPWTTREGEARLAQVRCPASLAPIVPLEAKES